jgi:hypothetical protein
MELGDVFCPRRAGGDCGHGLRWPSPHLAGGRAGACARPSSPPGRGCCYGSRRDAEAQRGSDCGEVAFEPIGLGYGQPITGIEPSARTDNSAALRLCVRFF